MLFVFTTFHSVIHVLKKVCAYYLHVTYSRLLFVSEWK